MRHNLYLGFLVLIILWGGAKSQCSVDQGCDALASYYVWSGASLTFMSEIFSTTVNNIVSYNPQVTNPDVIQAGSRLNVPFSCGCVNNEFMGHQFVYRARTGNTYRRIADLVYSNLTTVEMMTRFNSYPPESIPQGGMVIATVNCSCGDSRVSSDYGLFLTYPLRPGEDLLTVATGFNLGPRLLQDYNPDVNFTRGSGLVFVPVTDRNGTYPPLRTSSSGSPLSGGAIAGISIAAVLSLAAYLVYYRRKKDKKGSFPMNHQSTESAHGVEKASESGPPVASVSPKLKGITVDKSVEFTYEELAKATNDFNVDNKIGQGGFGDVFRAELRGEKAAIKKMGMKASEVFMAELKVLTDVNHVNLVRLIGYCVEGSLCLVYEFIDNGNLSQHLRGREPLPWSTRLQIALDSARGLEYIHEHTVPVYIHRDIKSANILINRNFRAKVADFGLAKLIEVSGSWQTRIMGTFGYMPLEYAQRGNVSRKTDVYAFGVVLFELISGKEALIKKNEDTTELTTLVDLFKDAFKKPDQTEAIRKLVDPRLADDYPFDSVSKVAHLAKDCTHEDPQLRPSMEKTVVELMTLSSSTEDGTLAPSVRINHLMSGR